MANSSECIPFIAYDRLIEDESVFYLTFDNVEVGRLQAQAVFDVQPTGSYVFIKGSPTDPIVGAMLGVLLMQSLQSGMVLVGLSSPLQQVVIGAVWLDVLYRHRNGLAAD